MEAYVDNMRSVMKFYDAMEKASGIKTSDFENAYQAENLMHGANEREHAEYKRMYTKPMLDEVKNVLSQMDGSVKERYEVLKRYLIAKHGLERNRALAFRDAIAALAAKTDDKASVLKAYDDYENDPRRKQNAEDLEQGRTTYRKYLAEDDRIREDIIQDIAGYKKDGTPKANPYTQIRENKRTSGGRLLHESLHEREYSGLHALAETDTPLSELAADGFDDEEAALKRVEGFESEVQTGVSRS